MNNNNLGLWLAKQVRVTVGGLCWNPSEALCGDTKIDHMLIHSWFHLSSVYIRSHTWSLHTVVAALVHKNRNSKRAVVVGS